MQERALRALRDELALTTTLFQDKEKQIAMLMQELEEEQSTRLREKNSSSVKINKTEEERDKIKREHALCAAEVRQPCVVVVACTNQTFMHKYTYIRGHANRQSHTQMHAQTRARARAHIHNAFHTVHICMYTELNNCIRSYPHIHVDYVYMRTSVCVYVGLWTFADHFPQNSHGRTP